MKPTITYDGKSVVSATMRVSDGIDFDTCVTLCQDALRKFDRSKPGSDWGCDGVGYYCQSKTGVALCHRSGVGPRKYKEGMARVS